jgi:hypothetical protein
VNQEGVTSLTIDGPDYRVTRRGGGGDRFSMLLETSKFVFFHAL